MKSDTSRFALLLSPEDRKRLDALQLRTGIKAQTLARDCVLRMLEQQETGVADANVNPYRPENRSLHDKLEAILNSGDEGVIGAVVPNIEIFFDRMKPPTTRRKTGSS